ncbi:MAG TPA: F0F1 ATP synthase subunit B [Candidatus Omnitrophota bacterium]|nr:F0F1 ATP synthase subunit B [Candidatus Omnitrophota bacterium]
MMSLDFQQIITQAAGFLVLLVLLKLFFWRPMLSLLDERKERIASQLKDIENAKSDLSGLKADYEKRLNVIEETARLKVNEAILEGQRITREIKDQAHQEARRIIKDAREYINEEFSKAKEDLKNHIAALAVEAASRIIEAQITEKDSRRIVQDFLDKVKERDERENFGLPLR